MPLSFPIIEPVDVAGARKWVARCRTCGWVSVPQSVKVAADEQRRSHGPEKTCSRAVA